MPPDREGERVGSTEVPARSDVPPARSPTRLFDWREICPDDVARPFPALAGSGRGEPLDVVEARRKLGNQGTTQAAPVK